MVIIPDGCTGFFIPALPYEQITAPGIANPIDTGRLFNAHIPNTDHILVKNV